MLSHLSFVEVLRESVDLSYHDRLNPKFWENEKLKPIIRYQLLKFSRAWAEFAGIPNDAIEGAILTGGNANYNYTSQSDLDVHTIIDKSKMPASGKLLEDFLQNKKQLWTLQYDVRVLGCPVEPYAQDKNDGYHPGQGVYSLTADTWLQRPVHGDYDWSEDPHLEAKVSHYVSMINDTIKKRDSNQFLALKDRLKAMRTAGISKDGEFSFENLVFKALRNGGHLDRLSKAAKKKTVADLSLRK